MRYLDPKNDLTFKKVFCEHPAILIDLLNSLLDFPKDRYIKSITYLPPDLSPINPFKKNSIVDVRCTDNYDRQFIVEMQMIWTDSFTNRVIFNASKAFVKQLDKGENYSYLHPVYSVNLVNDIFLPRKRGYYHDYKIVNGVGGVHILEGLSFLFIELPKVNEYNLPKSVNRALWLRFFTEIQDQTEQIAEELKNNPNIKEALEILEESAFSMAELEQYDRYWDSISVERTYKEDAARQVAEAQAKLVEGKAEAEIKVAKAEAKANEAEAKANEAEAKLAESLKNNAATAKMLFANGVSKEIITNSLHITLQTLEEWLA